MSQKNELLNQNNKLIAQNNEELSENQVFNLKKFVILIT